MSLIPAQAAPLAAPQHGRYAYADNLKVVLVVAVIVGHVTMAYTGISGWVLEEPPVRDPLLGLLKLAAVVGVMFAMALFFMVAGVFTPRSLARKGTRRFLLDRTVRLGVPVLFYVVALAPIVEYVDADNVGWTRGFPRFAVEIWTDPAPGPTWFLGVLLLFSLGYAVARRVRPAPVLSPLRARYLIAAALVITVSSYAIRLSVPFGEEWWHLALGQAPAWVTGFALGVVGAERGWFEQLAPAASLWLRRVAFLSAAGVAVTVFVVAGVLERDEDVLFGGGTWLSLVVAGFEGPLVVAMSVWLFDVFRRRVTRQGRLLRLMSRAAFAAFVVHQVVAVGAVLLTRRVDWPPELEFVTAATLAVAGSFAVGALLVRIPGVARII